MEITWWLGFAKLVISTSILTARVFVGGKASETVDSFSQMYKKLSPDGVHLITYSL